MQYPAKPPFYLMWKIYFPILLSCALIISLYPSVLAHSLSYGPIGVLLIGLIIALPYSHRTLGPPITLGKRAIRWLQLICHQIGFLVVYLTLCYLHQQFIMPHPKSTASMIPSYPMIGQSWLWLTGLTWSFSYLQYTQQCLPTVSHAFGLSTNHSCHLTFSINFYIRQAIYTGYSTAWILLGLWGYQQAMQYLQLPIQWGLNIHLIIIWLFLLTFVTSKSWLQVIKPCIQYRIPLGMIHLLTIVGTIIFLIIAQQLYQIYQIPSYQSWFTLPQLSLPFIEFSHTYFVYGVLIALALLWTWQIAQFCQGLTLLDIGLALGLMPLGWLIWGQTRWDDGLIEYDQLWIIVATIVYLIAGLSWRQSTHVFFFSNTYIFGIKDKHRSPLFALQGLLTTLLFGLPIWLAGGQPWYDILVYLFTAPALVISLAMIIRIPWRWRQHMMPSR